MSLSELVFRGLLILKKKHWFVGEKFVNDSYYLRKPASFRSTNSNGGTHSVITVAYLLSLHFTVEGNGNVFLHEGNSFRGVLQHCRKELIVENAE